MVGTRGSITRLDLIHIDDPTDVRLADYRNIPDRALAARGDIFVAEGRLVVSRLLSSPRLVTRSLLLTEAALGALAGDTAWQRPANTAVPAYLVPPTVMATVTGFDVHRGCLAIGERPVTTEWAALAAGAHRLVVAERIANADNVGALFRNAAAFGVDGVLLDPACTDPLYRKAIRTSMGATLHVPFARVEPWPDGLLAMRASGFSLVALSPTAPTLLAALPSAAAGASAAANGKIAIIVGHEGDGLSPKVLALCDHQARIPMAPGVDSLNVATATALALYELQRHSSADRYPRT